MAKYVLNDPFMPPALIVGVFWG